MPFAVINALSQRYFLQANDQKDLKDWVEALNQASKITVRMIPSPFWRGSVPFPGMWLVWVEKNSSGNRGFPRSLFQPHFPYLFLHLGWLTTSWTESMSLNQVQGEVYRVSALCFLGRLLVLWVMVIQKVVGLENGLLTMRRRVTGKTYEEGSQNFVLAWGCTLLNLRGGLGDQSRPSTNLSHESVPFQSIAELVHWLFYEYSNFPSLGCSLETQKKKGKRVGRNRGKTMFWKKLDL